MEKLQKFIAIVIMVSLLLTSCTFNQVDNSKLDEVKTFTMFSVDLNSNYNNFISPVAKEITRQTGVRLDIEYNVGNVTEKLETMLTTGEYPDLLMVKEVHLFVDEGAFIDLAPLIEEHGPNIKKLYGEYYNRLRYSYDDTAIYNLPAAGVDIGVLEPFNGFELQHAVVKDLGYPEINTLEDYENAIKEYIKKYPTIEGKPTIGITLVVDDWRWLITLGNPAGFATGLPDDGQWYIDIDTYEASYKFQREEFKEYFRWLNHMYDIGLIDPDSFVQKYEAYEAKISEGRVLGLIDSRWQFAEAEKSLRKKGLFERTYGYYPVQLDETTQSAEFRETGYLGGYGIGITTACNDPVKAIQFLDYLAS
jgi:putative aldouronate transport system substrate-binding protein